MQDYNPASELLTNVDPLTMAFARTPEQWIGAQTQVGHEVCSKNSYKAVQAFDMHVRFLQQACPGRISRAADTCALQLYTCTVHASILIMCTVVNTKAIIPTFNESVWYVSTWTHHIIKPYDSRAACNSWTQQGRCSCKIYNRELEDVSSYKRPGVNYTSYNREH